VTSALVDDPRRLRALLDASRLLMLVVDEHGVVREVNRAVERATGRPAEASLRPIWELAALPAERVLLEAAFSPFRPDALPPGLLFHLATSGASRVIDWSVSVLEEPGERLVLLSGLDVSHRIAAEQHLREAEAFQRQILDRLPAIVWATDKDLRFTFSAGGDLAALGLGFGEVAAAGTSLYAYFHTNDPAHPAIAPHLSALRGEPAVFEIPWLERLFQARVEPFRDKHDDLLGTIGLAFDVTEQTRTARALEASESRLRRLVDANVIGICFWDEQGRLSEANDAFLRLVGASREDLQAGALSWRELTPPEDRVLDERALGQLRSGGRCTPYEKAFLAKDGTRVPVLVGGAALAPSDGGGLRGVSFVVDLREQARLRRDRDQLLLKEQAARMETEVANARLMLLVEGSKRLEQTRNPSETLETLAEVVVPALADWSYVVHRGWAGGPALVASAHGDPNKENLLRTLHSCIPDLAAPEGAARAFRTGEIVQYDDIQPRQLLPGPPGWPIVGTQDPAHLHTIRELGMRSLLCVPIGGRGGVDAVMLLVSGSDPHRYGPDDVFLARDLANRASVRLENGRLLFEALDAVRARNEFVAVAAHELRTPLTSALLKVQLTKRALDEGRPSAVATALRMASDAEAQLRRLSTLIDALLEVVTLVSHRLWLQVEEVELCALVKDVLAKVAPDLERAGCALTVAMPAAVTGQWDRARLEQVLTSLVANAMKFGAGRPIEVTLRSEASAVEISVRDHGIGISKEDQARIFERFERAVSTHHYGGLGLGLYVALQIVRAHQGSLRVESEPGKGACFTIHLPRRST
jgi:PAS domain S-box-containing protein